MRYLSILPLLLITVMLWGQDPDYKRMKRDIEVAENIIDALLKDISTNSMQGYRVDGTYLDSYGILFTIQDRWGGFGLQSSQRIAITPPHNILKGQVELPDKFEFPGQEDVQSYKIKPDTLEKVRMMKKENLKSAVTLFFADYGFLLTKLPEEERICIKYKEGGNNHWSVMPEEHSLRLLQKDTNPKFSFTAVIPQKVVKDLRRGTIDREALIKKIEFTENEVLDSKTDREIVLLNSIFHRLYQRDLSDGFFMKFKGSVEKVDGLGALFFYRFLINSGEDFFVGSKSYSSLLNEGGINTAADLLEIEKESIEWQKEHKDDQPDFHDFLEEFKTNVIEYGSTVRNLKAEEVLSFELDMPLCHNCDNRPRRVKITAKQSLLEKYRKGNIELEDAVEQLQVTY